MVHYLIRHWEVPLAVTAVWALTFVAMYGIVAWGKRGAS
jgi:hypothetical protein